ncbi:hypothetical protein J1605_010516 [Eschrichtius robustus]|uniref:Uncharacterized protein n=1 Tax=Eschrichtius robustus TaxID=9764 RepID=A0AB34GRU2_ESCRO|nr:hypothetical protein J1605_010516 [Eschrichtius robustus]
MQQSQSTLGCGEGRCSAYRRAPKQAPGRFSQVPCLMELYENHVSGASLVAQWLRIRLPMQGTRVQALVQEDPTCCRAPKPVHHNY